MLSNEEMTAQKNVLDIAARRSSRGLVEALHLVESFISHESRPQRTEITKKVSELLPGHIRSVDIYGKLMWFSIEVSLLCLH